VENGGVAGGGADGVESFGDGECTGGGVLRRQWGIDIIYYGWWDWEVWNF